MTILENIRSFLSKKTATAADLAKSISKLEDEIPGLRSAVEVLEAERGANLIDGDDKLLAAIEERLSKARRDFDRGSAIMAELQRRAAQAAKDEFRNKLLSERDALEKEAAECARLLLEGYQPLAIKLRAIRDRAAEANIKVSDWNYRHSINVLDADYKEASPYSEFKFSDLQLRHVEQRIIPDWREFGCYVLSSPEIAILPENAKGDDQ